MVALLCLASLPAEAQQARTAVAGSALFPLGVFGIPVIALGAFAFVRKRRRTAVPLSENSSCPTTETPLEPMFIHVLTASYLAQTQELHRCVATVTDYAEILTGIADLGRKAQREGQQEFEQLAAKYNMFVARFISRANRRVGARTEAELREELEMILRAFTSATEELSPAKNVPVPNPGTLTNEIIQRMQEELAATKVSLARAERTISVLDEEKRIRLHREEKARQETEKREAELRLHLEKERAERARLETERTERIRAEQERRGSEQIVGERAENEPQTIRTAAEQPEAKPPGATTAAAQTVPAPVVAIVSPLNTADPIPGAPIPGAPIPGAPTKPEPADAPALSWRDAAIETLLSNWTQAPHHAPKDGKLHTPFESSAPRPPAL